MLVRVKAEQVPIIINHRGVFPAITLSFDLAQSKSKRRPVNVGGYEAYDAPPFFYRVQVY